MINNNTNKANRNAWLEATLKKIRTGYKILDAGAGELANKKYCSHLEYTSQDFGQYTGQGDGKGLQTGAWDNSKIDIVSDITNIPRPDASYDAILCSEVLEHIVDPIAAIREFARLICVCGKLILTAPVCSLTHMAPHYYYNGFSRYWYERVLPENGFKIVELSYNGNYFSWMHQEMQRLIDIKKSHASGVLNIDNGRTIGMINEFLEETSKSNKGSEQLLAFGIHVYAERL
jgi:ubiquinone/menaquinone biosynthesis C-methylase UbiE